MTFLKYAALFGTLVLAAGSVQAATQVRIDCGDLDVILQEDQAQTIAEIRAINDMSGQEFATAVCELFSEFDPTQYERATGVKVVTEDREVEAEIQASQQ